MPDVQLRALGLVRVSKERHGMVSPEIQRQAISDYCMARGYRIVDWVEGLDESGSRARSAWWPRLEQSVAAVESGEYDAIVVWKFSRTARNRLKWAAALDRVEGAGGRLESATEQIDVTTSAGRFTRGMFGELAVFEAERIGDGWKEAHAARVRDGRPHTGKPKWGYVYDQAAKLHVPDPETGPVLADLYRRYVAGESVYALVRWLNGHGWRTSEGGPWSDRSLRRVLDSGFASGRFMSHGRLHAGVHEAVIDEQLWQAYVDARETRRVRPARVERSQYLLSGLVRCGRCEGPMVAGQFGHAHAAKYRCRNGKEVGPSVCAGGYVTAAYVEGEVLGWVRGLAGEVDAAAAAAVVADVRRTTLRSEGERLAREVLRVEEALRRLVVQRAESPDLPDSVFAGAREELTAKHRSLVAAVEATGREERRAVVDPARVAAGLLDGWDRMPVEHRREVLRDLVARVWVWTGRPRARVQVDPTWGG